MGTVDCFGQATSDTAIGRPAAMFCYEGSGRQVPAHLRHYAAFALQDNINRRGMLAKRPTNVA